MDEGGEYNAQVIPSAGFPWPILSASTGLRYNEDDFGIVFALVRQEVSIGGSLSRPLRTVIRPFPGI